MFQGIYRIKVGSCFGEETFSPEVLLFCQRNPYIIDICFKSENEVHRHMVNNLPGVSFTEHDLFKAQVDTWAKSPLE